MYRDRLVDTQASSLAAKQLQTVMIAYHDFQRLSTASPCSQETLLLTQWQSQRLKSTHADLYDDAKYQEGLNFLLGQLYSPEDFSARDRDLERVFPKLVKWLPDSVIETVAILVELNLLTQKLDHELTHILFNDLKIDQICSDSYSEAYRVSESYDERQLQISLVEKAGLKLDRYARNPVISWSLKLSRSPAERAGLIALHNFISNGFKAFHSMKNVDTLMRTIVQREDTILNNIFQGKAKPFDIH